MDSSQSDNLFGSDQDGFEDALMAIDLDTPSRPVPSHSVVGSPTSPGRTSPRKRKFSQTEEAITDQEEDINPRAMALMREQDDKNDIYGALSFGNWGQVLHLSFNFSSILIHSRYFSTSVHVEKTGKVADSERRDGDHEITHPRRGRDLCMYSPNSTLGLWEDTDRLCDRSTVAQNHLYRCYVN